MKDEYAIFNKTAIQNRIEELKLKLEKLEEIPKENRTEIWQIQRAEILIELQTRKDFLCQSTPLIPEIEKAFESGVDSLQDNLIQKLGLRYQTSEVSSNIINLTRGSLDNYILNLKLDI